MAVPYTMFMFLVFLLVSYVTVTDTRNPGMKIRITENGLNYGNKIALQILTNLVRKIGIAPIHQTSGKLSYDITNVKLESFPDPKSAVRLNTGHGLIWNLTASSLTMHGDFAYKYKNGIIKISDHGTFDVSVSTIAFSLGVDFVHTCMKKFWSNAKLNDRLKILHTGLNPTGRLTIKGNGCSCSISGLKLKFHGGKAWIYNLFSKFLSKTITKALQTKICQTAVNVIDNNASKQLAAFPVKFHLQSKFLLDYSMTQTPTFTRDFMETFHKGEIYWTLDEKEAPLPVPSLVDVNETSNMVYLVASDFLFNSAAYAGQEHGFLQFDLTRNDLPDGARDVLNTTCRSGVCVGKIIPNIKNTFPNSTIELNMTTTQPPNMTVVPKAITVNCTGDIVMNARLPNGSLAYVLTFSAGMMTTIDLNITNDLVYVKLGSLKLNLTVSKTAVGPIDETGIQFIIDHALDVFIVPQLNTLGAKGFPLPVAGDIKLRNTKIKLERNTIIVGTDLHYDPSKSSPLHFVRSQNEFHYNADKAWSNFLKL